MRAIQRAIVGVGLAVVAMVAMALLIGGIRSIGPDSSNQPAQQTTGPQTPLADGPTGPPEPVDAAEDTSVGTLPPPADASLATQLASRDLLAPPSSAPDTQPPAEGTTLSARKAPAREKSEPSGQMPTMPEQDFTATQDGWDWSEWSDPDGWYDDSDDCQRDDRDGHRYDRRDDCGDDRRD